MVKQESEPGSHEKQSSILTGNVSVLHAKKFQLQEFSGGCLCLVAVYFILQLPF